MLYEVDSVDEGRKQVKEDGTVDEEGQNHPEHELRGD